jgi:hypothetical protein
MARKTGRKTMQDDWEENENGNWILLDDSVVATVYKAGDD